MQWDRFFMDLEDQLASEWDAERASLDVEAERLRLSQVALRGRLRGLVGLAAAFDLADDSRLTAAVEGAGADWVVLRSDGARAGRLIVPVAALVSIGMPCSEPLSAVPASTPSPLADRLTFGFVMRDLARRRVGISVGLAAGRVLTGTIDRAGGDHLDLAQHDRGAPRRSADVSGCRVVPFAAMAWVRVEGWASV
ncbi:hypothetical protein QL996_10715 [Planococcus sp. APC 4015]|nr:hypothetical protein [Planococcus sp. APC 4015]